MLPLLVMLLLAVLASSAPAVIIDSGDGTGNTSAPGDDPGWANVGRIGNRSAVYLGNGWVLTAHHVGVGTVSFGSQDYDPVPNAELRLDNGDGSFADLLLFGISPEPNLPALEIRTSASLPGGEVTLIGYGRNRGAATDTDDPAVWLAPPEPPDPSLEGYLWASGRTMRWGTNRVEGPWLPDPVDTVSFYTDFDLAGSPGHTAHEAQSASGDSGGAVFAKQAGQWELAGLIIVRGIYEGQLGGNALEGNYTGAADLSFYADDIERVIALPEPDGGLALAAGAALLLALAGRRAPGQGPST